MRVQPGRARLAYHHMVARRLVRDQQRIELVEWDDLAAAALRLIDGRRLRRFDVRTTRFSVFGSSDVARW